MLYAQYNETCWLKMELVRNAQVCITALHCRFVKVQILSYTMPCAPHAPLSMCYIDPGLSHMMLRPSHICIPSLVHFTHNPTLILPPSACLPHVHILACSHSVSLARAPACTYTWLASGPSPMSIPVLLPFPVLCPFEYLLSILIGPTVYHHSYV